MKEVRICLIIETRESLKILDELCSNLSLDEIYIGVYDLSLSWKSPGIDSPKMLDICREFHMSRNFTRKDCRHDKWKVLHCF